MLMSWGPLQFDVVRTNIHEWGRATSADWAKHEVLGAPIQKEFTGPGDDELVLRGRVFPMFIRMHFQGPQQAGANPGLTELELIQTYQDAGVPQMMVRGDGVVMGWYVLERFNQDHSFLDPQGRGKIVGFEAHFSRFPGKPQPEGFFQSLFSL
jgi:phage protein U